MRLLLLVLVFSTSLLATPSWFFKLTSSKTNSYIGYGSGLNIVLAKQEAFTDISSQISVSVDSTMKQEEKMENGKFTRAQNFSSLQTSNALLNDYKVIKMEYSNGTYFVAIEYENIPSLDKFINKVALLAPKKTSLYNAYLQQTSIAKKLKKALHRDIDFKLVRKDGKWFIKYKSVIQVLDKKDFASFFTSTENIGLSLQTNKRRNILYDGDKFYFKVKSSKDGYVSILTVYEDGTVATLVRNIKISKKTLEKIPDEDFESIPQAGLIVKGVETYDLYVLVYSTKKLHFDSFAYADSELINEEKYKNFDELIEFLDKKNFTTLKVVTKARI